MRKEAIVVYKFLPHYRQDVFKLSYKLLANRGITFTVWYGTLSGPQSMRNDTVNLPFAQKMRSHKMSFWGKDIYLHIPPKHSAGPKVFICEQALKVPLNFLLLAKYALRKHSFIWWGHGRNFQQHCFSLIEIAKKALTRRSALWFSYTTASDSVLENFLHVPPRRIWRLDNAIDTNSLSKNIAAAHAIKRCDIEKRHSIPSSSLRLIFCGGLHADKGIPLLLTSFAEVSKVVPDAQLVVIGDGPERIHVESAAAGDSRIKMMGFSSGDLKVDLFAISDVYLCPGMVGLNILDAFSAGLPFITVDIPHHSPEVAYLAHGRNGLIVQPNPTSVASAVLAVRDPLLRKRLSEGALQTAKCTTVERMAARFCAGVIVASRRPRYGRCIRGQS
jgi:L-malate glycosyltransferase